MSVAAAGPRAVTSDPTLSIPAARGIAFFALAAFGALHWMVLFEPAEGERALYALGAAGVATLGLLAAASLPGRARPVAATAVTVVAVALGLLAGGVADELLRPDEWGTLGGAIGRGIESLPGVRVPYRGVDEAIRLVIGLGGTLLTVAAALVAFWPRRRGTGFPAPALGLLVALYAIPAVALDFENEFLRGAALALLVLAFLRLEKLRVSDAGTAGMVAAGIAVLALMLAPALDGDEPWWDYESWALGAASARSTAFSWDHDYGPLDWPRDGRELLRVRAQRAMYWKAANLEGFNGLSWMQIDPNNEAGVPFDETARQRGRERISVTIRNLSSESFVAAGYAESLDAPTVREIPRGDGTYSASRTLRRGDAYTATVYEPEADQEARREADEAFDDDVDLDRYLRLFLPATGGIGQVQGDNYTFDFPRFGDTFNEIRAAETDSTDADVTNPRALLTRGPYAQTWRLSQRLRGQSLTQEDYVQAVLDYLRDDEFSYSENPPRSSRTLEGFLFDGKAGYCQQYSGAMALLLRMGGVPARVATGFTSGSLDSKTREWVVRDLDAHSWVEVWYDGIGWETFDPTPADAPPRAQPNEGESPDGPSASLGPPSLGGDRPADPGRRALAEDAGPSWGWIAVGAIAALAAAAGAVLLVLRRRRRAGEPPAALALDELERALRRARRHPGPGTTLRSLEQLFARSPAAAGYVRAVRELRYGGRPGAPSAAQRRGLRNELGRGAGLAGRLRAWWALPPRAL
jgi:transglutaminase-like putative cysteine protease